MTKKSQDLNKISTVDKLYKVSLHQNFQNGKRYYVRSTSVLDEDEYFSSVEFVLASKFARVINEKYFSSEHTMDTGQTCSTQLAAYAISRADNTIRLALSVL